MRLGRRFDASWGTALPTAGRSSWRHPWTSTIAMIRDAVSSLP